MKAGRLVALLLGGMLAEAFILGVLIVDATFVI